MDDKRRKILLQKELKIEFRRISYITSIIMINMILFICVAYYYNMVFSKSTTGYSSDYKLVLGMYNTVLLIEYILILCTIPFTAGVTMAREYESKTFDLLMLSKFSTKEIINIKIIKIILTYLVVVISTLPILSIVFSVGVVNIVDLLIYVLVIMSSIVCYSCIGMYISVKTKKAAFTSLILCLIELASTLGSYILCGFVYNLIDDINKSTAAVYSDTQMKFFGNLLVTNPVVSIFKLQSYTQGNASIFRTLMNNYGVFKVVDTLWIPISVLLQLGVAWWMIVKVRRIMIKRHFK